MNPEVEDLLGEVAENAADDSTLLPGEDGLYDGGQMFLPSFETEEEFVNAMGGMRLPGFNNTSRQMYDGKATGLRKNILSEAHQYLNLPYVWGGTSKSKGVDCSGLIQSVLASFGVEAPRVSFQQANMGPEIDVRQAQPGDLIAWDNSTRNNGADHIAFYLGDGKILEAPRTGERVRIRSLGADEDVWAVDMSDHYRPRG